MLTFIPFPTCTYALDNFACSLFFFGCFKKKTEHKKWREIKGKENRLAADSFCSDCDDRFTVYKEYDSPLLHWVSQWPCPLA